METMNRTAFITALGATAAIIAVGPVGSVGAAPVALPAAANGLSLWEFSGFSAWVVAATEDEARRRLQAENGATDKDMARWGEARRMAPGEHFTMYYEDGTPEGLEGDEACDCDPASLEEFGCECDASQARVTLCVASWCQHLSPGEVIGEYNG